MFEGIQRSLSDALKKLRGRGRLTEANIREGLQEVRKGLLDADVNFNVVQDFIQRVTEKSLGQAGAAHHRPQRADRQDHLRRTGRPHGAGRCPHSLRQGSPHRPDAVRPARAGQDDHGRQTRPDAREQGRKPLLVAADLQRPAAVEQLKVLGDQIGVAVYSEGDASNPSSPVHVCRNAVELRQEEPSRYRHPRHGRPAAHRRHADGRAEADR